jgi:spoIIIJ-associated protein
MEWVETTGRTIAEALDAALDELGVDEDDVEYEVLEHPKSGFLGRLGSSEARIRARVKPISREKPGERQRRKGRGSVRPRGEAPREADAGGGTRPSGERRSEAGTARRRRSRGRSGADAGASASSGKTTEQTEQQGSTTVDTSERDVPIEEQAEAAEVFTQGLVDAFELGAMAKSVIDDDVVLVEVTGENLGLLVGPRGATLHAIEELVRTVVQRQTDGHGVRIHVDVAGYRAKRREALEAFTRDLAAKVIETGRPQALEPMSAADRKVVHDVAAGIEGVVTESEGEDPRRRVVLRRA